VADLGDDTFQPDLAGVREHLFAVDLKAVAELDRRLLDQFFQVRLALDERQLPQILAIEIFTALHLDQFAEPAGGAGHGRHVASAARFCSTVMPALLTATSIAIALSTTTNPSVVATK